MRSPTPWPRHSTKSMGKRGRHCDDLWVKGGLVVYTQKLFFGKDRAVSLSRQACSPLKTVRLTNSN